MAYLRLPTVLLAAATLGCRDGAPAAREVSDPEVPARPPNLRGVVAALDTSGRESLVVVVGDSTKGAARGVRASHVEVLLLESRPLTRVRVGCRVRVWYLGGELRESDPGQATAAPLVVDACP
jgi:hypothetical protein